MQNGVNSVAERRGNTGIDNRLNVESLFLLEGFTVLIIIAAALFVAFALAVIISLISFSAFDNLSRQNIAGTHLLAAEIHIVVQKTHDIAFLQFFQAQYVRENFAE